MSKVLTEAGLPCSHEGLFGPYGPMSTHREKAESSWMAVPFLDCLECPVVVVVREPTAVVQSLLGIGFFEEPSAYLEFARTHVPEFKSLSPVNAAWTFWLSWNRRAMEHADVMVTLDGDWSEALASVTSLKSRDLIEAGQIVGVYNSRKRVSQEQALQGDETLMAAATKFYADLSIRTIQENYDTGA